MALFNKHEDFSEDLEHFKDLYECNFEEFISKYGKGIVVEDLTDKVVVSVYADNEKQPLNILAVFIPEEDKYNYKATLVYAGHIAFIKIEYTNGKIRYFYKDDECYPQYFAEAVSPHNGDLLYCCMENGFTVEDMATQIERFIQTYHDFRFKLDTNKLIILEGL